MKKIELIAPGGSLKKLKYAIEFGADAVFIGIPDFSLRVRINNFDIESIKEAIEYAHKKNKKVYVTINIYAHNEHINKLPQYIKKLKKFHVDGLIVSDPGVIRLVKQIWPEARIHLSTQANTTNWQAAKFWYDLGVKRIVLARECTLDEIREIHRRVPKLELEYFVHGAMCMSYSGRCILSKYFTGKSANLGDCTQPCRWKYNIKSQKSDLDLDNNYYLEEAERRVGELFPIEEDMHGTYILNSKDLCLIKHLNELSLAGITAFKIEGRAKSVYYVGVIVSSYRKAIDNIKLEKNKYKKLLNKIFLELQKLTNHGFSTGFLFGKDKFENDITDSKTKPDWEFVGEVIENLNREKQNKYWHKVLPHNSCKVGDRFEVIQTNGEYGSLKIIKMINSATKEEITSVHGGSGTIVEILTNKAIMTTSLIRKKIN